MKIEQPVIVEQTLLETVLRDIAQGISTVTDDAFFVSLVQHLAEALNVRYAFIGQLTEDVETHSSSPQSIQIVAMWADGQLADTFAYKPIPPCLKVLSSAPIAAFPCSVRQQFPNHPWIHAWQLESYIGIPLLDSSGRLLGLMSVMDTCPIDNPQLASSILQIFATRAAAELARKRTEDALRESETRYRMVSQLISAYAYGFCLNGTDELRLDWLTESVLDVTGFTEAEIRTLGWQRLIHPDDLIALQQDLRQVAAGRSMTSEYRIITKGGHVRWLHSHSQSLPRVEAQSTALHIVGSAHDITESKQTQIQLQTLNLDLERQVQERTLQLQTKMQRLQQLNQLKDDFLSTVSHELRTPLTNMKMAIHMLQLRSPQQENTYLKILQGECQREMELINDLLSLQRLEAEKDIVQSNKLTLEAWLPQLIEPFQVRAQQQQQRLSLTLDPDLPEMCVDDNHLKRILAELLNNACKYTQAGGEIAMTVSLQTTRDSTSKFVFMVSNEAEIPSEERSRIFEKFYRIPSSDRWKEGGTGLGLALVKKLTERLSGEITVDCHGGWTYFALYVPQANNSPTL
ncbi:MAG: PAS domain-containing protein [Spirulina sp. SIO3F2]|nr:PAS domain-containing protein [Spirulina sp. SIO3F2]